MQIFFSILILLLYVAPRPQIGPGTSNPLDPPDLMGQFTADLVCSNQQRDTRSGVMRIQALPGYSTSGTNRVVAGVDKLDVFRTQQRLRYLGWPSSTQLPVQVDGNLNDATRHAIGLFNSAVQNNPKLELSATIHQGWINAPSNIIPLWRNTPKSGIGWSRVDNGDHVWGTSWARELIDATGLSPNVPPFYVNDLSLRLGGITASHSGHQTGIGIDIETPSTDNVLFQSVGLPKACVTTSHRPFFVVREHGCTCYVAGANNTVIVEFSANNFTAASPEDPNFDWSKAVSVERARLSDKVLYSIRNLIVSPSDYDYTKVKMQIDAFIKASTNSGASVRNVFCNDPRTWDGNGSTGVITFKLDHGGHFYVDIRAPQLPQPQSFGSLGLNILGKNVPVSGFGTDSRLFFHFELPNGFSVNGRSDVPGEFRQMLTPNANYKLTVYQASTNKSGIYHGSTNSSGQATEQRVGNRRYQSLQLTNSPFSVDIGWESNRCRVCTGAWSRRSC